MLAAAAAARGAVDPQLKRWTNRLIPMPQEIAVDGSIVVPAGKIKIAAFAPAAPRSATALRLLQSLAGGGAPAEAEVVISLHLNDESARAPDDLQQRLAGLPNADQAYAIAPDPAKREIMLVANSPEGLLYAVRTLLQLVDNTTQGIGPATELEIPWARIVDWPDIRDRGTFCCIRGVKDYQWMGKWKLNFVNYDAGCKIDNVAAPGVEMFGTYEPILSRPTQLRREIREAAYAGVRIQLAVSHLEQLCLGGHGLLHARRDPKMEKYLPVLAVQDPNQKFDPFREGLSFSNPATTDLLADWLGQIADISDGFSRRITVWLSEGKRYCHADMQQSTAEKGFYEQYVLEIEAIEKAAQKVRRKYPWLQYDVALSQACRPDEVRQKIFNCLPPDVGVHYYDGGVTYVSSKKKLIFPMLAEFAAGGGRAGLVPTITHACGTVVPWTGLPYLNFRCKEAADKKLQTFMAFIQPDRYHCELELTALAEWSWNADGRTPAEFAEAYASVTKICAPGPYAGWTVKAGNAGWLLADSLFLNEIPGNPSQGLFANQQFGDNLYRDHEINNPELFAAGYRDAVDAMTAARNAGIGLMIAESEVTLTSLQAFDLLKKISALLHGDLDEQQRTELAGALGRLDKCAHLFRNAMQEWTSLMLQRRYADGIEPPRLHWLNRHLPLRLQMAANAIRQLVAPLELPDPRPLSRGMPVGAWELKAHSPATLFEYDVSRHVPPSGGQFYVSVDNPRAGWITQCDFAIAPPGDDAPKTVARLENRVFPICLPPRATEEKMLLRPTLYLYSGRPGKANIVLTQVYSRDEYPDEFNLAVGQSQKIEKVNQKV